MFRDLSRQSLAALRLLIASTLLLGIGYPLVVWLGSLPFGDRARGEPVRDHGIIVGSALIGQDFTGARWFHGRPSAGNDDTLASGATNLGPDNPQLLALIRQRRAAIAQQDSVAPAQVPPDAVTASGSGLDPQISPEYAAIQIARVARVNHLSRVVVEHLVALHTSGRSLGFAGEPGVNVLTLNLALDLAADRAVSRAATTSTPGRH